MPWDWPVAVNYHEAKAYCKWKGREYRIMTEAEHHAIRDKVNIKRLPKMLLIQGLPQDVFTRVFAILALISRNVPILSEHWLKTNGLKLHIIQNSCEKQ